MKAFFVYLSKVVLKFALDKAVEQALPKIYERLDTKLPTMLFNGASPKTVESEIGYIIQSVTGKPANKNIIDIVTTLYDPIQNAIRTQHRPR